MRYCRCMENTPYVSGMEAVAVGHTIATNYAWIETPYEMSLSDAFAAELMTDTLIRTQDGAVYRKIYGKAAFERLTDR